VTQNLDLQPAIQIEAEASYLENKSEPEEEKYAFSYQVRISNHGQVAARLLSRHWIITDANGKVEEVRGQGVVGEQPYLRPGESFHYTSGTVVATPIASMHGSYQMVTDGGNHFDAQIPPFSLAVPRQLH